MAIPQKENGFTPIANEIMEALAKIRIPGESRSVLDVILRKTYGWNKKEDFISLTQFVECTGLHRASVVRALKRLINMGVVAKVLLHSSARATSLSACYSFQKNYENWRVVAPVLLGSSKTPQKVVAPVLPTKEYTKEKRLITPSVSKKAKKPICEDGKHRFKDSPFYDPNEFRANIGWSQELADYWWDVLADASEANAKLKYNNWLAVARQWRRRK